MSTTRERAERPSRPSRTPINGTRNILKIKGQEAGYMYRVVNDEGDRIAELESAGYELVKDKSVQVGDRRVANPTQEGSPVKVSVGKGTQAYVMRIREDWYKEDQKAKLERVNELDRQMKSDANKAADYGKIEIS